MMAGRTDRSRLRLATLDARHDGLDFVVPPERQAGEPPEARGLARDEVRLMVSHRADDRIEHRTFREIAGVLAPGDALVINTSGTMNAALRATYADGTPLELHLSTRLPADLWIVELRLPDGTATRPFFEARAGRILQLPDGATATLLTPYRPDQRHPAGGRPSAGRGSAPGVRLWIATLGLPDALPAYLQQHGFPIRYGYVRADWPLSFYQTVYATEPGSAEMPSAGRAFTPRLLTRLMARGIQIAPLILHTGVASLEAHEPPYEEYYRVSPGTARTVNAARATGRRVVAVGTTVVRALETVTDVEGTTHPGEGWTNLVITPERGLRAVDGLLTGFHEPGATHLALLQALAGKAHVRHTYAEALRHDYLWHEFGDLHLIFGNARRGE